MVVVSAAVFSPFSSGDCGGSAVVLYGGGASMGGRDVAAVTKPYDGGSLSPVGGKLEGPVEIWQYGQ